MITRQHMTLVLLSVAILILTGIPVYPWGCLAIVLGASIGTILPDIQMKKPKRLRLLTLAWMIVQLTRYAFIPVFSILYRIFFGFRIDPADKRITHSIPGMILLAGIIAGLASIPTIFLRTLPGTNLIPLFVLGFILGLALHMIQDLCTRKGITPLYPFRTLSVSGSIRPCIVTDTRIGKFQIHHCSAAAVILGIQSFLSLPGFLLVAISGIALCICLGIMIRKSDITITDNSAARTHPEGEKKPVTSGPGLRMRTPESVSPEGDRSRIPSAIRGAEWRIGTKGSSQ